MITRVNDVSISKIAGATLSTVRTATICSAVAACCGEPAGPESMVILGNASSWADAPGATASIAIRSTLAARALLTRRSGVDGVETEPAQAIARARQEQTERRVVGTRLGRFSRERGPRRGPRGPSAPRGRGRSRSPWARRRPRAAPPPRPAPARARPGGLHDGPEPPEQGDLARRHPDQELLAARAHDTHRFLGADGPPVEDLEAVGGAGPGALSTARASSAAPRARRWRAGARGRP